MPWGSGLLTGAQRVLKTAFQLCGQVPKELFDEEKLHKPLQEILAPDFDLENWNES
ncbi:hypothetical protein PF010_g10517 [Phytophthora fragariae]|uniref:Uncharacterized protein n=1 Tax=Phytophthora fragariae TaxID=53985 RepID=A0A6A3FDY7_9STRA|nr:hypothetical protein PF003_g953 [Phytophthora fragariae]KAE8942657.1 hypothetical protein PF009_g7591 [Phytophthora fragariae]KAE9112240.1 hypothetical protein PF010_g10517 [Phytophthora fragariae]KAE9149610.1 hypothetical protein PF006_g5924 [Phytophthora fragariae]